jgi:hypothetical protein
MQTFMSTINLRTAGTKLTVAIAAINMIAVPLSHAAGPGRMPGEQRRWALQFRTRLEQPGGERPVEINVTGDWVSTVSAVRPGEYDVALELSGARLTGDGSPNVAPQAVQQVERRLARPFWATYCDDGALLAVHFFKDVEPGDRNLLQMVASEVQLVRPNSEVMHWTVLERDGGGSYLAVYNRDEGQGLVKRKLKYVQADGATGLPSGSLHVDMQQSELRFTLDSEGEVTVMDGNNRVRIGIPLSDEAPMVASTETHLSNLRRSREPDRIGSLARAGSAVEHSPIATHKPDPDVRRAQQDAHLLEGRTTKSLLDAAMANDKDQWLSERLEALFRRRPEAVPAAAALLRQSGAQWRITSALGSAGSSAAIEGLANLARDSSVASAARVGALTAFIKLHHPSPEAMRIPATLLDDSYADVRSAAQLMSGAMARAGRSEHPREAEAIDAGLIARYRKAREISEISDLLAAFGNSVGPSIVPVIKAALQDSRVSVRVAATRGLRLAEGSEIDGLLSAIMAADLDPTVREAAIFAAGFRAPTVPLGEALERAARSDPAESVRNKAVALLRQNPQASPGISDTLAWVAGHDSTPGIRRLTSEALASVSAARRN